MITIYSKAYCPYCSSAKSFLESIGQEYQDIDLEHNPAKMAEIIQLSGMMTVPQIFNGEHPTKENLIGGYDDMMAQYKAGKLFIS